VRGQTKKIDFTLSPINKDTYHTFDNLTNFDYKYKNKSSGYIFLIVLAYILAIFLIMFAILYRILFFNNVIIDYLIITSVLGFANTCLQFNMMMAKTSDTQSDTAFIDISSTAHILMHMLFTYILMYCGLSLLISCIISILSSMIWELFEAYIVIQVWYNFGSEGKYNHLSDVIMSIVASLLCWLFFSI